MNNYSITIQKIIDLFSKFPTVGKRTASRFAFYLINQPKEKAEEIIKAVQELKEKIKLCSLCFNPFEQGDELCEICSNNNRDKSLLCIVEKEADLLTIENTKKYKGLYFILGGNIATLKKLDSNELRTEDLLKRVKTGDFKEVIVATNPTPEGKATALLIDKTIKETASQKGFKITRLGQGLPVGGELEYADEETLESAFEGRK